MYIHVGKILHYTIALREIVRTQGQSNIWNRYGCFALIPMLVGSGVLLLSIVDVECVPLEGRVARLDLALEGSVEQ